MCFCLCGAHLKFITSVPVTNSVTKPIVDLVFQEESVVINEQPIMNQYHETF